MTRRGTSADDCGQSTVLVACVLVFALVTCVAIGRFATGLRDEARAQTAADAAALAGLADGADSAERLARANGAVLLSFTWIGSDVMVEVRIGDAVATARAGAEASP